MIRRKYKNKILKRQEYIGGRGNSNLAYQRVIFKYSDSEFRLLGFKLLIDKNNSAKEGRNTFVKTICDTKIKAPLPKNAVIHDLKNYLFD